MESSGLVEYIKSFEIHKRERTFQQLSTQEFFRNFLLQVPRIRCLELKILLVIYSGIMNCSKCIVP